MSSFRTVIPPIEIPVKLSHHDSIFCIGSCFTENIGGRLSALKFPVLLNPFGIVYNPVSVADVLEKILTEKSFTENDLFENLGLWHSFSHHGRFSHPDKNTALQKINNAFFSAIDFLKKTNKLIVTLGTANVFVHKKTEKIVANCHKVLGIEFKRRRLSVEEVSDPLISVFKNLRNKLPELEIIVTISPLRHLRDGLIENQKSKATLLLGLERIISRLDFVHYFPSYEIMLDDLRDYRFYEKDMAHPNQLAIDYIWEYFTKTFFNDETNKLCQKINKITTAVAHRPFHPASEEHQNFIKKQLGDILNLNKKFPFLDLKKEKEDFQKKLM